VAATPGQNDADPFGLEARTAWPAPGLFRAASGAPGPDYWQQRADYAIDVSLDTTSRSLAGRVSIKYTNNSPDTLRFLWLQLDQNLYRAGSKGAALFAADSRWGVRGFKGGYTLTDIAVNGQTVSHLIDETLMRIDLSSPLTPRGGKVEISMRFSFLIPDHGSDRMGRDGTLYQIAQWYPRMAVYDDIRGWNTDPYLGQGEFYLEYGTFDYEVTVPAGYTVAGTGKLENAAEVLSLEQRARLDSAARSERVISVITAAEAKARAMSGTKKWHFRAENVRDVAWSAAPDFRWDATSWNGVLCQAFYQVRRAGRAWETAAEMTRWSIRYYSELLFPYPYPQATSVAGAVMGMEYPMLAMVHYGTDDQGSILEIIDHEHGHQWFPIVVGSNERRYAWQDEGFNTYLNALALETKFKGRESFRSFLNSWRDVVDRKIQSPLMAPADEIHLSALGAMAYRKPALALLTLRNYVLGPESFDPAFREYAKRWSFKHPTPADFFRTMENVSGADLTWYWRFMFYGMEVLDIGIDTVTQFDARGEWTATIALSRMTTVPFPVAIRVKYADGGTEDFRLPVQIWAQGSRFDARLPVKGRIIGARLWPLGFVPDWNSDNDRWGDAPDQGPPSSGSR
jgi:hypothetical protein